MKTYAKGTPVEWSGEDNRKWRAVVGIEDRTPVIFSIDYYRDAGWINLCSGLTPDFEVTAGIRKMDNKLGSRQEWRWYTYNDLPMNREDELEISGAEFDTRSYEVVRNGLRTEVTFDGLKMGYFTGNFRLTVYEGSDLLRAEVIASNDQPSLCYLYRGGLKGFKTSKLEYIDVHRNKQEIMLKPGKDETRVPVRARNRNMVAILENGSIAVFPPPHSFFFARQLEINLGFVYYKRDVDGMALGVRHNEKSEYYETLSNKRAWACYNAPPGTLQRMAAFFCLSDGDFNACRDNVMAYTHNDRFKRLEGYRTMTDHFHMAYGETWARAKDVEQDWIKLFKEMGVDIAYLNDFHGGDGHEKDNGPVRQQEFKTYIEACRAFSDESFLIVPGEEPNCHLGGHWNILLPRPVYYSRTRGEDQPFIEQTPDGKYYHLGSSEDVYEMLEAENGVIFGPHPRTKSSEAYPDGYKDSKLFKSKYYTGIGFRYMPADLSYKRLGDGRNFSTLDDINNWSDHPKHILGEVDTYKKTIDYDLYGDFNINYVKVSKLPAVDDCSMLVDAVREGNSFVTTGEVLIKRYEVSDGCVEVDLEWTFPMEFCEAVYSDGEHIARRIVSMTDNRPFGETTVKIEIPEGMKWVRFTAWDCAANGAFTQPVFLMKS